MKDQRELLIEIVDRLLRNEYKPRRTRNGRSGRSEVKSQRKRDLKRLEFLKVALAPEGMK